METIEKIGSFIWNIIEIIGTTITDVVSFIKELPDFINNFLSFLPTEIYSLLIPIIFFIIAIFIYRFVR